MLAFTFALTLESCGLFGSSYPDLSETISNPSDQFIIASTDSSKVSRAFPFKGTASTCDGSHGGAHIHFNAESADYTVNIYSPVAGEIENVEPCFANGDNDKYDIDIGFAEHDGDEVQFNLSIEPMAGKLCSTGSSDYYQPYILVSEGDKVTKGQLIAKMLVKTGTHDDGHIHFHMSKDNAKVCPNIFNATVEASFASLYGSDTCASSYAANFCFGPGSGQDITGL
jgi:hypothetical protein